jgi:hypothetical protein
MTLTVSGWIVLDGVRGKNRYVTAIFVKLAFVMKQDAKSLCQMFEQGRHG